MSTYVWVALVPTLIACSLGFHAWQRRSRPGAGALGGVAAAIALWSGGYALELLHSTLRWKIVAAKIQYLGIATVPVAWLFLALAYTHSARQLTYRARIWIATPSLITILLAWTNEFHGLIWSRTGLYDDGALSVAVFSYGAWFAVHVAYSYALMLMASAVFLRTLLALPYFDRQSLTLVVSALLPWLANLAHISGLNPVHPLDLTPFAFALAGLGIWISLRRFRFLDVAPIARSTIVDRLHDAIIVVDEQGNVVDLNPAAHLVIGTCRGEILGRRLSDLFDAAPEMIEATGRNAETTAEIELGDDEHRRRYAMHVAPVHEPGGRVCGKLVDLHDITELREAEARVQFLAYRDELTGLPNRQLFRDRFDQALATARRERTTVACLFLDLDDFKKVNDHYGHSVGDQLLREAAGRIRRALREVDTVSRPIVPDEEGHPTLARFGGDEFVVLLQGLRRPEDTRIAAERVVGALREPFRLGRSLVSVSTSIGISVSPGDGDNVEVLLRNADAAMYEAKRRGGDGIRFFTRALNEQARARVETESALHRAVAGEELNLHYRPVFDIASGAIRTLAAEVMWEHPTRGVLPVSEFMPIAEASGLALEIGRWQHERAVTDWLRFRPHLRQASLAFRISGRQLADPEFLTARLDALAAVGVGGTEVQLEILERALMQDLDRTREALQLARRHGVQVMVVEFGSGISSLSHLREFAPDAVEIGGAYTAAISDPGYERLVRAIIALARELGLAVSADGVDSRAQLDFLRDEGCDRARGELLGRSQSAAATLEAIRRHPGWPQELAASA